MRKILLTLLFTLFSIYNASALDILGLSFSQTDNNVITFATTDNKTLIYRASFMTCGNSEPISLDFKATAVALSNNDSAYIFLADNNSIVIYDRFKSTQKRIVTELSSDITSLSQDDEGKYIVASDGKSLALYKFTNETLRPKFKKDFLTNVSAIMIDSDKGQLFTVEVSGVITAWNFRGKILRVNNIKKPILKAIDFGLQKRIAYLTRNGVSTLDYNLKNSEPLVKIKATDFFYDKYGSTILMLSNGELKLFDVHSGEPIKSFKIEEKNIYGVIGKNILATSLKNYAFFYDSKTGVEAGALKYTDTALRFSPPKERPALFGKPIGDNLDKYEQYPVQNDRVCAPFSALITGLYLAKRNQPALSDKPKYMPVDKPTSPDMLSNLKEFEIPVVADVEIKPVKKPIGREYIEKPNKPIKPEVETPQKRYAPRSKDITNKARLLADSDIPLWIVNRNRLDKFEVVRSGATEEEAIENGKKELRNRILKHSMNLALAEKSISRVEDAEVKKRLLWSISSSIASNQEHKITVKEKWLSSNGQSFVLMNFNSSGIDSVFKNIYDIEFEKLMNLGNKKYMALKPNTN